MFSPTPLARLTENSTAFIKLEVTLRQASLPNLGFSGTIVDSLKHLNLDPKEMTARAMKYRTNEQKSEGQPRILR